MERALREGVRVPRRGPSARVLRVPARVSSQEPQRHSRQHRLLHWRARAPERIVEGAAGADREVTIASHPSAKPLHAICHRVVSGVWRAKKAPGRRPGRGI